jgi:hypothetical protein
MSLGKGEFPGLSIRYVRKLVIAYVDDWLFNDSRNLGDQVLGMRNELIDVARAPLTAHGDRAVVKLDEFRCLDEVPFA